MAHASRLGQKLAQTKHVYLSPPPPFVDVELPLHSLHRIHLAKRGLWVIATLGKFRLIDCQNIKSVANWWQDIKNQYGYPLAWIILH